MAEEAQETQEVIEEEQVSDASIPEGIKLNDTELTEAQTHINLIQKAYRKLAV